MKNQDVAEAWKDGRPAYTKSMWTDGETLWSYHLPIGRTVDGKKVALRYDSGGTFVSVTTSNHVSHAKRVADETREP